MVSNKPSPKNAPALELERRLLRGMCSPHSSRGQLITVIDQLANYAWLMPEHATVFQAIRCAVRLAHDSWRDLLPAQATRMGFPDVAWSEYFATDSAEASLNELATRLISGRPSKRT